MTPQEPPRFAVAPDQHTVLLTDAQRAELDRRLDCYETDGHIGRIAEDVIAELMKRISAESRGSGTTP